jgi:hypothetical protein
MEAPKSGLNLKDLNATIKIQQQQMYEDTGGGLLCKKCSREVQFISCAVSIHYTPPGGECVESNEICHFPLPYCPSCEGEPTSQSTCVHMGTGSISESLGEFLENADQRQLA